MRITEDLQERYMSRREKFVVGTKYCVVDAGFSLYQCFSNFNKTAD